MKLVKVNPVYNFNAVDRLLNEFFTQGFQQDSYSRNEITAQPATNLYETENVVEIEMLIPGFEKDQVTISVEKDQLVVAGKVEKQEEKQTKFRRIEFKTQNFEKKFRISDMLDAEKVNATFKNGILKIVIAKKEEVVAQKREIEIA